MRNEFTSTLPAILALALLFCSASRPEVPGAAVDKELQARYTKCEVHHTQMVRKAALQDEAFNYSERFHRQHWKRFPHDGYIYNVCQTPSGAMTWVCEACVRYSKPARKAGRIGLVSSGK